MGSLTVPVLRAIYAQLCARARARACILDHAMRDAGSFSAELVQSFGPKRSFNFLAR